MTCKKNKTTNSWVRVEDAFPELVEYSHIVCSDVVLGYGYETEYDKVPDYILVYMVKGNRFYSDGGECYQITHWQPLPPIPTK